MWIRDPARALRTALSPRRLIYNLLSLIVVFSMLAVAEAAWQGEQHHQRVELLVEQVRLSETQLGSYLWQAVAETSAPRAPATQAGSKQLKSSAVTPPRTQALPKAQPKSAVAQPQPQARPHVISLSPDQLYSHIAQSVAALRRADNAPSTLQIVSDAHQLDTVGITLIPPVPGGDQTAHAIATVNTKLIPMLTKLDQATAAAYDMEAANAQLSAKHASWVYSGTLIAGLLLLVILGARLSRLRHKSALVEERRVVEVRAERRLRGLIEHSSDIILVVNADLTVRWQSSSAQRTLGYGSASLVGQRVTSLVHDDDTDAIEEALHALPKRGGTARLTVRFKAHNGISSHYEVIAEDRLEDRDVEGLVLSMRDVTERMALEDELRHQAFHDSLTGLANRALFEDRLVHTLAGAVIDERLVAVLFLDLDNFKTINDSLGHVHGDELLRAVAKRIGKSVGGSDTAARLGGDEFAVLIEHIGGEEEARDRALILLEELTQPFMLSDRQFHVGVSIGVALSDGRVRAEELLRNADTAMYAAKDAGKRTVEVFNSSMHQRVLARLELTEDLTQALRRGDQLEVDYQPIVELDTGAIVGFEALVRWAHPLRGRLYPSDFIGLAEDNGLIVPLGEWVLQTACAQASLWLEKWPERSLRMNVNVSARQLHDPEFPYVVARVLRDTGLPARLLVLEITESLLPDVGDDAIERLNLLKALGLRIAVDDFGTGYSALSRLHDYPLDILKIDRSFVDGMEHDQGKHHLVRGIVDLGRSLGIATTAEGVETREQLDVVRAQGCTQAQGRYISPPLPGAEVAALLEHVWL